MPRRTSVAEVRVPALFLAVHTPVRFATIQLNFGVVLARHGFSERRTSPAMVRCVFGGLYPRSRPSRDSQGRYPGVSQPEVISRTFPLDVLWPWILLLISWDRIGLEPQDFAHLCNIQLYRGVYLRGGHSYPR